MFENFFGGLKEKFQESQERKRVEKEEFARMQREADFQRKQIFEEQFRKDSLEVAKARAKKDAANLSGLQKLRATNRLRNLNKADAENPTSIFSKLSAYTQRNMAKREENLKRTEEIRKVADEMRKKDIHKEFHSPGMRKPFQPSGFGNKR